jgi:hypothetical protein
MITAEPQTKTVSSVWMVTKVSQQPVCLSLECIRVRPLVDVLRMVIVLHAEDEEGFPVVENDLVPINPALADVLDIVMHDELFASPDQLKVTYVRKEIWLHQSDLQVLHQICWTPFGLLSSWIAGRV